MERKEQLKGLAASCGTTSKCPYCYCELSKIPKRKAKCQSCKKAIYPRKDPLSGEPRLYREGDLFLLEELKALADGWWNSWYKSNKSILSARKDLANEWGTDEVNVSIEDARWRKLHTDLADGNEKQDWNQVYLAYESILRLVQRERSQEKTPLSELVAGFMVTGYGRNRVIDGYRIGRPQFMLIEQLTTEPDNVYDLIKDTYTAKSYCNLLDVSLNTIIERYMSELEAEAKLLKEIVNNRNKSVETEVSLNQIETQSSIKPNKIIKSNLLILLILFSMLGLMAFIR
ncbi:hypothetical protein [Photobacterium leiognathi]|uniref:hypothetical protein n=1 Tax=Photobacterium leiognathi TaxID=553611 RepID=UPI002980D59C|nr:hypothetical protein [Photobacterium leiognathi]